MTCKIGILKALIFIILLLGQAHPDNVWVFVNGKLETAIPVLQRSGFQKRYKSTWFNAVSGTADKTCIQHISSLPFVEKIRPVSIFKNKRKTFLKYLPKAKKTFLDSIYGHSHDALKQIGITDVFNQNIIVREQAGRGIRIALFDSGFDIDHEVFSHFTDSTIIAKRDYVAGMVDTSIIFDTTVYDDSLDYPGQEDHGTSVLSLIGGFLPGKLMGAAPYADFALIKTERNYDLNGEYTETFIEEAAWIAGLEWVVDSLGVDIVASSVLYRNDFTDGRPDYTLDQMNGDSILITQAADMAAQKGVIVVVAVGNDGGYGPHTVYAPADGDSVIAVGATFINGGIYAATSYGPTGDGRDKPDISAPGEVYVAEPDSAYTTMYGTSGATPLVAGGCALLIQAVDSLKGKPYQVMERIKKYAYIPDNILEPMRSDPRYGKGIMNIYNAILDSAIAVENSSLSGDVQVVIKVVPNPFNSSTIFKINSRFKIEDLRLKIYDINGKMVNDLTSKIKNQQSSILNQITWNPTNLTAGIYLIKAVIGDQTVTKKLFLLK
jgi:subtilisin family serine protease